MSLKPQPPRPQSPELAAWGAKHLVDGDFYKLIGDVLYEQYRDEEFADCYHAEGRPAISPVLLAFVTVFQARENLSDRFAARMVEMRDDWKYALHLPSDVYSFDPTVLCDFRARLLEHDADARIFERLLTQLKALGLLRAGGIQRTDSLAIMTKARKLSRIELLVETLRVVVRDLLKADEEWANTTIPLEWEKSYGRCCKVERLSEEEKAKLTAELGSNMQWLLEQVQPHEHLRELHVIAMLQTVFGQHFVIENGVVQFTPKSVGKGADLIETPYDPEARWSRKGDSNWVGDKLQVTETDDADKPHLITDIDLTTSVEYDSCALPAIRERQEKRDVLPGERYADKGYIDGPAIDAGKPLHEDLIGPIRNYSSPQTRLPDGFTHADFDIDFENGIVTCPNGKHASIVAGGADGQQALFAREDCEACPLKARCCTGKKEGRSLRFGPHYETTQWARERQKTDEFKLKYRQHRGGVEGCLSALVRGQGIRVNRYIGRPKNNLRMLFVGVAVNIARSAAWLAGHRPKKRRACLGLAGAAG